MKVFSEDSMLIGIPHFFLQFTFFETQLKSMWTELNWDFFFKKLVLLKLILLDLMSICSFFRLLVSFRKEHTCNLLFKKSWLYYENEFSWCKIPSLIHSFCIPSTFPLYPVVVVDILLSGIKLLFNVKLDIWYLSMLSLHFMLE